MWFIALLSGGLLGAAFNVKVSLVLAAFGALAGAIWQELTKFKREHENKKLLEDTLQQLSKRIDALERQTNANAVVHEHSALQASPATAATRHSPALVVPPAPSQEVHVAPSPASNSPTPPPPSPQEIVGTDPESSYEFIIEDPLSRLWRKIKGDNPLMRVGLLVLFLGLAFFASYAVEHDFLPIPLRIMGIATSGLALLGIGWRLRTRRPEYALALQGGGVGVLYLAVYAALRLYALISPTPAFVLFASIALFAAILALSQGSQSLAFIGTVAGFATPILASTGSGSHIQLFSFYALLNLGIFGMAWRKSWPRLSLAGMVFTFFLSRQWAVRYYRPEFFASTEPFLVGFFLLYLAVAVLHSWNAAQNPWRSLNGPLIFLPPLAAFGLQNALVADTQYGLTYTSLGMGAIYLLLAWVLSRRRKESLKPLLECLFALGVGFLALAIALGLDGRWSAAFWALGGLGLFWTGARQKYRLAISFGLLLQLAAGLLFLISPRLEAFFLGPMEADTLGMALIAASGLLTAWVTRHAEWGKVFQSATTSLERFFFIWGCLWWLTAGFRAIGLSAPPQMVPAARVLFMAICALGADITARKTAWELPARAAMLLLPGMLALFFQRLSLGTPPSAYLGWLVWPVALGAHFFHLWYEDNKPTSIQTPRSLMVLWHILGFWLLMLIASQELRLRFQGWITAGSAWDMLAWAASPCAALCMLTISADSSHWPFTRWRKEYVRSAGVLPATALLLWCILAGLGNPGDVAPLPFLPLFNPLDVALFGVLLATIRWCMALRHEGLGLLEPVQFKRTMLLHGVLAFAILNGAFLRTVHHFLGVPYRFTAFITSDSVQAGLSILWGLLGISSMLIATRNHWRTLWLAGSTFMVLVVIKLFLVDMANRGAVERIVSFIVIGVLLLAVGYFSPLPPKKMDASE